MSSYPVEPNSDDEDWRQDEELRKFAAKFTQTCRKRKLQSAPKGSVAAEENPYLQVEPNSDDEAAAVAAATRGMETRPGPNGGLIVQHKVRGGHTAGEYVDQQQQQHEDPLKSCSSSSTWNFQRSSSSSVVPKSWVRSIPEKKMPRKEHN